MRLFYRKRRAVCMQVEERSREGKLDGNHGRGERKWSLNGAKLGKKEVSVKLFSGRDVKLPCS